MSRGSILGLIFWTFFFLFFIFLYYVVHMSEIPYKSYFELNDEISNFKNSEIDSKQKDFVEKISKEISQDSKITLHERSYIISVIDSIALNNVKQNIQGN